MTTLRVVLGMLCALALLGGAMGRPHGPHGPHEPHGTADASAASATRPQPQHEEGLGNDLTARHHRHHHHGGGGSGPSAATSASGGSSGSPGRPRLRHHPLRGSERHYLCGSNLSDALRSLCSGRGYNSPDSYSGASRHRNGGSVTECCLVGCSMRELEQYCQPLKTPPSSSESESEEPADDMHSAPRTNDIRPAAPSSQQTQQGQQGQHGQQTQQDQQGQQGTGMPTVVGGSGTGAQVDVANLGSGMIRVGTLHRTYHIPIPAQRGRPATSFH
ncbi:hypothetical protein ONE63_006452 [Megalurothrips usitatus]|uniref:Insulin-like domain-containing protein n=1 Tax=Megalurothrips usitatus TaxID=439358 RepID=A0AAV7XXE2_9NEOP|nr:hypothetical protein ONE63_006452 [Megalurothrips usitatus]